VRVLAPLASTPRVLAALAILDGAEAALCRGGWGVLISARTGTGIGQSFASGVGSPSDVTPGVCVSVQKLGKLSAPTQPLLNLANRLGIDHWQHFHAQQGGEGQEIPMRKSLGTVQENALRWPRSPDLGCCSPHSSYVAGLENVVVSTGLVSR
jgi:hypothetical protein